MPGAVRSGRTPSSELLGNAKLREQVATKYATYDTNRHYVLNQFDTDVWLNLSTLTCSGRKSVASFSDEAFVEAFSSHFLSLVPDGVSSKKKQ
jgi:hypothetical protein